MDDSNSNKPLLGRRDFVKLTSLASAVLAVGASAMHVTSCAESTPETPLTDICFMNATDLAAAIRNKRVSAVDVMNAFYDRIELVNPKVNAIVALLPRNEALALAQQADEDLAAGKPVGKLHGMPWALKDMEDVKGFPTTKGSLLYKDNYPQEDGLLAARLRAAGALFIGKTNVPEFGAGSNTFNPVYGPTLNPFNLALTCGGSTGGGAVAIVTGMLPICDGSDTGGSLRNPGSWNNVVGFRPSVGRVPADFPTGFFLRLPTEGPMGRNVKDTAYLLSVMAGPDYRDPVSNLEDPNIFAQPLDRSFKGTTVAWTPNLGYLEVAQEIQDATAKALPVLRSIGCQVENAHPDLPEVFATNKALRSLIFTYQLSQFTPEQRKMVKESVQWEAAEGEKLNAMDVAIAETRRARICANINKFLEKYEFLVLPVTQVAPFPVEQQYPTEINGKKMQSYLEWMEIVYAFTLTGLPAISVPCAFTPDGMPVGLQIIGRRNNDLGVLQLAYAFEQAANVPRPMVPKL
ncbi:MAG: amidase [Cyclobacteriaceae bacterium]|jgi:amidase|nr:amidase [Cyclobacteriaceae bacterium]